MFVNHYIMKFDKLHSYKFCDDFTVKRITEENVSECKDGEYDYERIKSYIKNQNDKCEGFLFYADGKKIGYIWVIYKGGTEIQYKIRNIDAFLFYFCVFDDERGKGYSEKIMSHILAYIKNEKKLILLISVSEKIIK